MRRLFETIDNEDIKTKHNFSKASKDKKNKYTIEDIHYAMMYHLHI